jgi:beta-galactosidase
VDVAVGAERAIVITCDYPGQVDFYAAALAQIGAEPALRHDSPAAGIFLTSTAKRTGERFLHVLNLDGFAKSLHLTDGSRPLFNGQPVTLAGREALMLPLNLTLSGFEDVCIAYATAEITALDREAGTIEFRLAGDEATIAIATSREVETNWPCELRHDGATTIITARRSSVTADRLTVRLS